MYLLESWGGWTIISSIGTLIAAVVAIFYTWFTYHLLKKSGETLDKTNSINEFLIYKEISSSLSRDETVRIMGLCLNNNILIDYKNSTTSQCETVNSNTFNRYLLNPFEDISVFLDRGLISIATLNTGFGYTILKIGNCKIVTDHISNQRKELPNVYGGFEELYNKIYQDSLPEEQTGHNESLFPKLAAK